jgi:hypothetical protein
MGSAVEVGFLREWWGTTSWVGAGSTRASRRSWLTAAMRTRTTKRRVRSPTARATPAVATDRPSDRRGGACRTPPQRLPGGLPSGRPVRPRPAVATDARDATSQAPQRRGVGKPLSPRGRHPAPSPGAWREPTHHKPRHRGVNRHGSAPNWRDSIHRICFGPHTKRIGRPTR